MNCTQRIQFAFSLCLLLLGPGCATIMSGPHSEVTINSNPPNAHVVIQDRKGKEVAEACTPTVVKLDRGYNMLLPARYTATVVAPGYQPKQIDVSYQPNPWLLGNLVLGGVIGLVADDATGAIWKPKQDTFAVHLKPEFNPYQTHGFPDGQTAYSESTPNIKHPAKELTYYPGDQPGI